MTPELMNDEQMLPEEGVAMVDESVQENEPEINEAELFEELLLSARDDDRAIRNDNVRVWRRLDYYWNNILDIFLDPVSKDWRVPDWNQLVDDGEVAPRLINIYRPHGEAIVAALSVSIPAVIFHPDDADNPDDLEAAQAYRSIVDLLALHNEAPMLFIRALVILLNQGTIFGYNYYHQDPKYGTLSKPRIEFKDIELFEAYCPQCGDPIDAGPMNQAQPVYQCQTCGYTGPVEMNQGVESLPQIVGFDDSPKGSIAQKLFSGLQVKVPAYAVSQEHCGYLLLEFIQSTAMLRSIFKENQEKIESKQYQRDWDQFSKLPIQYFDQTPDNASNVSCLWVRPWQFYDLGRGKFDVAEQLIKKYPKGAYAIFIDDQFMEVVEENMDEHWTFSSNPFATSVYARPLGENLAVVQDIKAELIQIELETVEHGIPENFADPQVLNFEKYGEGRSKPGMMTQAKPKAGKSLGDAFFSTKSAILSQEVEPFSAEIDQLAQFTLGSFPSVYGGPSAGGSKTASEYSQSRAMALQRLGTTWKIICNFWSKFQSRSAVEFATVLKELGQDEKFTKREGVNSFINVWIKSTALSGRIGRIEPESTEQLPATWAQKKDAIMLLLQSGVDEVIQTLVHPNNAELMKEVIGVPEFYIPGEEDRMRQRKEFILLSQGQPVPIRPEIDNEEIHIAVLKSILEGPLGEALGPEGQQASMQHLMEHEQSVAMKQEQQQEQELAMQVKTNSANKPKKENDNAGNQ